MHGAAICIAMTAACASAPGRLLAPKMVSGVALAPYATLEECVVLDSGERIAYRFEARQPVAFNVHFHDGNAVIMPVASDSTTSESGDFAIAKRSIAWRGGWSGGQCSRLSRRSWPRQP
jgi:hypothetical protein